MNRTLGDGVTGRRRTGMPEVDSVKSKANDMESVCLRVGAAVVPPIPDPGRVEWRSEDDGGQPAQKARLGGAFRLREDDGEGAGTFGEDVDVDHLRDLDSE